MTITSTEGNEQNTKLNCTASGFQNARLSFIWTRNNEFYSSSPSTTTNSAVLDLQYSDVGNYTCNATSNSTFATYTTIISQKSKIFSFLLFLELTVLYFDNVWDTNTKVYGDGSAIFKIYF